MPDGRGKLRVVTCQHGVLELEIHDHVETVVVPSRSTCFTNLRPGEARLLEAYAANYLGKRREIEQLL